jgi:spermidine/putrescine transport system permease protein
VSDVSRIAQAMEDHAPPRSVGATVPERPSKRRWTTRILPVFTTLVILYLMLPIFVMILYSFNQAPNQRVTFKWNGFTTEWYKNIFGLPELTNALKTSIFLALAATVVATFLGTLIALALVRYRYRGKTATDMVMFMNISAPEIVLGASLLTLFVGASFARGFGTLLIAHVMFSIAYVTITVRARLSGFDRSLEEAAGDLYATPTTTFFRVTLPIIWPGVLAGALLVFALSIDDFVISNFVNGTTITFPLWVYGAVKTGIPPQVFVMGTLIFTVGVLFAVASLVFQRRKT